MTNNELKLEHLKDLLQGRREEYAIFGMTGEDALQDNKIKAEIKSLSTIKQHDS